MDTKRLHSAVGLLGPLLVTSLLLLSIVACKGTTPPPDTTPADAQDGGGTPIATDGAVDAAPDVSPDTAACHDPHQYMDRKELVHSHMCWEPPFYYCAYGGGAMMTRACRPDLSYCCTFTSTCVPCGWLYGTLLPTQAASAPDKTGQAECTKYTPTNEIFCWDGLTPPWESAPK